MYIKLSSSLFEIHKRLYNGFYIDYMLKSFEYPSFISVAMLKYSDQKQHRGRKGVFSFQAQVTVHHGRE